jgi:hypothetical protein
MEDNVAMGFGVVAVVVAGVVGAGGGGGVTAAVVDGSALEQPMTPKLNTKDRISTIDAIANKPRFILPPLNFYYRYTVNISFLCYILTPPRLLNDLFFC